MRPERIGNYMKDNINLTKVEELETQIAEVVGSISCRKSSPYPWQYLGMKCYQSLTPLHITMTL